MVDTSALVAIVLAEPDASALRGCLVKAPRVCISAATAVELEVVVHQRLAGEGRRRLRALQAFLPLSVIPFDEAQARVASEAYRRFGRGSRHPAKLNFGDCFSYALARSLDAPLLFKGDDFTHTDIRSALDAAL